MQDCRLLIEDASFRRPGAINMAIDEVLLQNASETQQPTLRFYGWQPATLSLGYFQKVDERQSHAASLGCDLVRRASGGGAIMHDHELTYAFAVPTSSRWSDTEQMYLAFHETLIDVLSESGVTAKLHSAEEGLRGKEFLCFQRRASGDVTCHGHKILGSAQRRSKHAILQHGSLLLEQSSYAPELPGLKEIASFELEPRLLIQVWRRRLASRLKINFLSGKLSDTELSGAIELRNQKFLRKTWTARR
jgi:lipoate-protein ligase A